MKLVRSRNKIYKYIDKKQQYSRLFATEDQNFDFIDVLIDIL